MKRTLTFLFLTASFLLSFCDATAQFYFTTTWKTNNPGPSGDNSITIPTNPALVYSYQVDWNGDNDFDDADESDIYTSNVTYNFPGLIAASRTIKIKGTFPQMYFNNNIDKEKIISIDQWGDIAWKSMEDAFSGCSNLVMKAQDNPNLSSVDNMARMFRGATDVGTGNGTWNWNTSNITDMAGMFRSAGSFDEDISSWNVEGVTDFAAMFLNNSLSTINYDALLTSWDSQDLIDGGTFNAGASTYCSYDARLAHRNLMDEDSLLINDAGLCEEGYFITTWKTNNPGSSSDSSITIPVSTVLDYFYQVDWNADGDFDDVDEDIDYTGEATHDYGSISASPRTIKIKGAFPRIYFVGGGDKEKILSVEQWGNFQISGFNAFSGAINLVVNALDTPVFFNNASLKEMFENASLIGTGTGNWDWNTTGVFQMESMFDNTQFNENIGSWDTLSVTNMDRIFANTPFDQNLELWRVDNVTTMDLMFLNGGLSTVNYDATLNGWSQQQVQSDVMFGAGNSVYCASTFARQSLIDNNSWSISDGGECIINQAPGITTSPLIFIAENNTTVVTIEATDPENDNIEFTLSGGADMNLFNLDIFTGELSFDVAPDFEMPNSSLGLNTYYVIITATDDGTPAESHVVEFEINVFDINEDDIIFVNGFE